MIVSLTMCMATVYYGRQADDSHTMPKKTDWRQITEVGQNMLFDVDPAHGNHVSVVFRVVRDYTQTDLNDRVLVTSEVHSKLMPVGKTGSGLNLKESIHTTDEMYVSFNDNVNRVSELAPFMQLNVKEISTLEIKIVDLDISREDKGRIFYSDLFTNKKLFILVAIQYSKVDAITQRSIASTVILGYLAISFLFNLYNVCKHGQFFTVDFAETVIGYSLCSIHASGIPIYYPGDSEYNKYVANIILSFVMYAFTSGMLFNLLLWRKDARNFWGYQIYMIAIVILYFIVGLLKHTTARGFYNNRSYSMKDHFKSDSIRAVIEACHGVFPFLVKFDLMMLFPVLIFRSIRMKKQHFELVAVLALSIAYMKHVETSQHIGLLHNTFDGHFLEYAVPSLVFAFTQSLVGTKGGITGLEHLQSESQVDQLANTHPADADEREPIAKNEKKNSRK